MVVQHSDIKPLLRLIETNKMCFVETLIETQKEVLEKYDDVISKMNGIWERKIFIYPFRLSGRFAIEISSSEEKD